MFVVHSTGMSAVVRFTTHLYQFTLLTAEYSCQLVSVEYGSLTRMYDLFSSSTNPISPATALLNVVKSFFVDTVKACIAIAGKIELGNVPSCHITGISHGSVHTSNAAAVHSVGLFNKSL